MMKQQSIEQGPLTPELQDLSAERLRIVTEAVQFAAQATGDASLLEALETGEGHDGIAA